MKSSTSFPKITPKRRRPSPPPLASTPPPPLSSPPPQKQNPNRNLAAKPRRSLAASLAGGVDEWQPLPLPLSELSLDLTFPTGQTFRWRRTGPSAFTGVVGPHLVSLRHHDDQLSFLLHNPNSVAVDGYAAVAAARDALNDYLNVGVSLAELWRGFSDADERFAELAIGFGGGARVLRQDPVECLFQFLCSSNNNIGRIERMVGVLSSFGEFVGEVGGFGFYQFPSVKRLAEVSEQQLREAGFGYRAKYIVGSAKILQDKPGGGAAWLSSLRNLELHEVIDNLCSLPGVGPKVAACIALFSLDQHHAIPVDTHVWKIATRYLIPELAGMSLTPKLSSRVAEAFVTRFGKYAGWAQNVLFIGELPPKKVVVLSHVKTSGKRKATNVRLHSEVIITESDER